MFDLSKLKLGSDKKSKLKDNMKEIRGMIESESEGGETPAAPNQAAPRGEDLEPPPAPEAGEREPPNRSQAEEETSAGASRARQARPPQEAAPAPEASSRPTNPRESSFSPGKEPKETSRQVPRQRQRFKSAEPDEAEGKEQLKKPEKLQPSARAKEAVREQMQSQQPKEPGETTETETRAVREVPKLSEARKFRQSKEERGPLFIEEEDFYNAEDIIAELSSLSNQLSSSIREMENTLLEDEEAANGIQKTISIFEETSEELESIFAS